MSGMPDSVETPRGPSAPSKGDPGAVVFVTGGPFPQSIRIEKEIRTFQRLGFSIEVVALREGDQPTSDYCEGVRVTRVDRRGGIMGKVARAIEKLIFVDLAFLTVIRGVARRHSGCVILFVRGLRLVRTAHYARLFTGEILLFYDIHDIHHLAVPSYQLGRSIWGATLQRSEAHAPT